MFFYASAKKRASILLNLTVDELFELQLLSPIFFEPINMEYDRRMRSTVDEVDRIKIRRAMAMALGK